MWALKVKVRGSSIKSAWFMLWRPLNIMVLAVACPHSHCFHSCFQFFTCSFCVCTCIVEKTNWLFSHLQHSLQHKESRVRFNWVCQPILGTNLGHLSPWPLRCFSGKTPGVTSQRPAGNSVRDWMSVFDQPKSAAHWSWVAAWINDCTHTYSNIPTKDFSDNKEDNTALWDYGQ